MKVTNVTIILSPEEAVALKQVVGGLCGPQPEGKRPGIYLVEYSVGFLTEKGGKDAREVCMRLFRELAVEEEGECC